MAGLQLDYCLAANGCFGVGTFVGPVAAMGIYVMDCHRSNAAQFCAPPPQVQGYKAKKGPPKEDGPRYVQVNLMVGPFLWPTSTQQACLFQKVEAHTRPVAVFYLKGNGKVPARRP